MNSPLTKNNVFTQYPYCFMNPQGFFLNLIVFSFQKRGKRVGVKVSQSCSIRVIFHLALEQTSLRLLIYSGVADIFRGSKCSQDRSKCFGGKKYFLISMNRFFFIRISFSNMNAVFFISKIVFLIQIQILNISKQFVYLIF